jgi:hypothetical protein
MGHHVQRICQNLGTDEITRWKPGFPQDCIGKVENKVQMVMDFHFGS